MTEKALDVLLVEDDVDHLLLARRSLTEYKLDLAVRVARDGIEALEVLFGPGKSNDQLNIIYKPRVILLDLKLPKMDGLEVIRQVKSHTLAKSIPVVVMSTSDSERDVAECYRSGANSYLVKPAVFDQFDLMIRETMHYWLGLNRTLASR